MVYSLYNMKLKTAGASILPTPRGKHENQIMKSGDGQPFNEQLVQSSLSSSCDSPMTGAGGGALTSPTGVTASSTHSSYVLEDLINEQGLIGTDHGNNFLTMWMSDEVSTFGTVTFDLGSSLTVYGTKIWQYNYKSGLNEELQKRGSKCIFISYSTDDVGYTDLGYVVLAKAEMAPTNIAGEVKNFPSSITARYIKFEIISNYENVLYSGLSEVKFYIA